MTAAERGGSDDPSTPSDGDPHARIAEHLAERGGDAVSDVPAGGAGADAGAGVDAVRVDSDSPSSGSGKYQSTHNDEPGIGTRGPDVDEENRDNGDPGPRA